MLAECPCAAAATAVLPAVDKHDSRDRELQLCDSDIPTQHLQHIANMPNMDYNPRMSMAPRSSQQPTQQKQKKEDDGDAFMVLVGRLLHFCRS